MLTKHTKQSEYKVQDSAAINTTITETDLNLLGLTALTLVIIYLVYRIFVRLRLSKAKHPSLRGHSKMSKRIAKFLPFYLSTFLPFYLSTFLPFYLSTFLRIF